MSALIGERKAEVSMTTGKLYTAEEALQIGLVDEKVQDVGTALKSGVKFLYKFQETSRK